MIDGWNPWRQDVDIINLLGQNPWMLTEVLQMLVVMSLDVIRRGLEA